jgi:hypothetical protein
MNLGELDRVLDGATHVAAQVGSRRFFRYCMTG